MKMKESVRLLIQILQLRARSNFHFRNDHNQLDHRRDTSKKKHQGGSAEFTKSAFKFKDRQIYLAKCTEPLPIRWSRQIPESCEPSTVTVRLHPSGRWHISIRFDDPTIKPLPVSFLD